MKGSREKKENDIVAEISDATTQREVKNICSRFVKQLQQKNVKEMDIAQSLLEIVSHLERFSPMNQSADQWSNIQTDKIELRRYAVQYW
ncbi:MAG: hypothetical protein QM802_02760 [Agriterribacter sp.]